MPTIYLLFYVEDVVRRYFYVGRTKDLNRRMREHRYCSRTRNEDVYQKMRELERSGIAWDCEVIDGEANRYAERHHISKLIRAGHQLMNMRHGSRVQRGENKRIEAAVLSVRLPDGVYQTPALFEQPVPPVHPVQKKRSKPFERSAEFRRKESLLQTLKAFRRGAYSIRHSTQIPAHHRELLLRAAGCWESGKDASVQRGNWTEDEVLAHLDVERWTTLRERFKELFPTV